MSTEPDLPLLVRRKDALYGAFLGGCGEFGMNMTAWIHGETSIIVDCGVLFPQPWLLGIDSLIADADAFLTWTGGVSAWVLTHGHEDHIGALPWLISRWRAPIYTTRWTAALLRRKFAQRGMDPDDYPITVVQPGDSTSIGPMSIDWIHVNHSIPDCCSLHISTPAGTVFHTGDFKFDPAATHEPPVSYDDLAALGRNGIDLLVADSTGALSGGWSGSETTIGPALKEALTDTPGRIWFTTFTSNLTRLLTFMDYCQKNGRRLALAGAGIKKTLEIALETGHLSALPPGIVNEKDLAGLPREKTAVLATGCQGEHRAALPRIIRGEHRHLKLAAGDALVFSSRMIPGNERVVQQLESLAIRQECRVINGRSHPAIHVSGHGYREDLTRLIELLRPACHLPVHGTFTQLRSNSTIRPAGLALQSLDVQNGNIIEMDAGRSRIVGSLEIGVQFVDSWSGIPLSYETMRERHRIGESGLAIIHGTWSVRGRQWLTAPGLRFQGIGFPPYKDQAARETGLLNSLTTELARLSESSTDTDELNERARTHVRRALNQILHKKPVVISVISLHDNR